MSDIPQCARCGKFCRPAAWKMVYSGAIPTPDHEAYLCKKCLETSGPFIPQAGIKPEFSCGVFEGAAK